MVEQPARAAWRAWSLSWAWASSVGVGAQQVVEGVPAGGVLGEQVRAGQLGQEGVRPGGRQPGQAGRGGDAMSGPGCRPSSRNSRAASALSARYDQENTARTSVAGSSPRKASSAAWSARSSAASSASGKRGLGGGARGDDGQRQRQPRAAGDDVVDRVRFAADPAGSEAAGEQLAGLAAVSRSSVSGTAPSPATRPVSWLRLVTRTRQPGEPGSSGRTWSASRALSSTTSMRLPASRLR